MRRAGGWAVHRGGGRGTCRAEVGARRGGAGRRRGRRRPAVRGQGRPAAGPAARRGRAPPRRGRRAQHGQVPAAGQPPAEAGRAGQLHALPARTAAPAATVHRPPADAAQRSPRSSGRIQQAHCGRARLDGGALVPRSLGLPRRGSWRAARGSAGGSEGDRVTGYVLSTVEDTRALGRRLAAVLRAGDLVVLTGPLGAGKTALAQGIGAGLGVTGQVTSPTFVIARVHRGPLPLVHADAYRIGAVAEIDDLDLDASLEDSVTLVEWGEGLVERLAEAYLEVRIERRDDESRVIELVPHGGDWAERLGALAYERSR